jgi:putative NADPH-quinone reductase
MSRRILLIQGHPDPAPDRLCRSLEEAYATAATLAGHEVRRVDVATLDFPLLRRAADWEHEPLPASLADAQAAIEWCEHLVLIFPLWLGDMPALLKGFLEQVARPGFAFEQDRSNPFAAKRLKGRSARIVVTMGMPALIYRWIYRAYSVRSLERNILGFVGFSPVGETLLGGVGAPDAAKVEAMRAKLARLGRDAA